MKNLAHQMILQRIFLTTLLLGVPVQSLNLQAQAQQQKVVTGLRLVVLPFRNLTGRADQDWIGVSLAESLTTALSQRPELALIERSQLEALIKEQGFSQSAFADQDQAPQIGRMLGAGKMLLGSYQLQDRRVLVQARIVDVETGRVAEGQAVSLEGELDQIFALQASLAERLLTRLGLLTNAQERQALEQLLSVSTPANYERYQKALGLVHLMSDSQFIAGLNLLEQIISEEPDFTLAQVALSEAFAQRTRMKRFLTSARSDDLNRALFHAEAALKTPDSSKHLDAVYRAMARAWQAQKKAPQALEAIRKALKLKPGDSESQVAYLEIAHSANLPFDQIFAELKTYQDKPNDPWVQFSLATLLLRQLRQQAKNGQTPDYSQVRSLLSQVRTKLPQLAYVPMKQAEVALLSNEGEAGLKYLNEALAIEPDNYLLYAFAGIALIKNEQQHPIAEAWLKKSIDLNPAYGFSHSFLGLMYYSQNKPEAARTELLKARAIIPESPSASIFLGLIAMEQEQLPEAYAYMLEALANQGKIQGEITDKGSLLQTLSALALSLDKPTEAIRWAREALNAPDLAPGRALKNLVQIHLSLDQVSEARAAFTEFSSQALTEAEQKMHSLIYLREQLLARPEDAAILNDLGSLALQDRDIEAAENYLSRALTLTPNQPAVRFNLGLLKLAQDQPAQAVPHFEAVLAADPKHHKAAFNLGKAWLRLGQKDKTRAIWTRLLQEDPGNASLLKALESL